MSGAIYFLESLIGRKNTGNGLEKGSSEEKQKKIGVIPMKKSKPQKSEKVISQGSSERKKALEDLNANFQKAYNASSKLKKLAKEGGTDIERFQIQAIHSQMRLVAKMLDNLKK